MLIIWPVHENILGMLAEAQNFLILMVKVPKNQCHLAYCPIHVQPRKLLLVSIAVPSMDSSGPCNSTANYGKTKPKHFN